VDGLRGRRGVRAYAVFQDVALSQDGNTLAVIEGPYKDINRPWSPAVVSLRDKRRGGMQKVFEYPFTEWRSGKAARCVCLNPDGTRLATAHGDGTVKVWATKDLFGR
jgi:WD40 repeat protein